MNDKVVNSKIGWTKLIYHQLQISPFQDYANEAFDNFESQNRRKRI